MQTSPNSPYNHIFYINHFKLLSLCLNPFHCTPWKDDFHFSVCCVCTPWHHLCVSQMAWGPFADMTLIYKHQGWMLHSCLPTKLIFLRSLSLLSLSASDTLTHLDTHKLWAGALYLATLRSEWHHTALWSNSIVSGINRRLMLEDLAAVHKGDCLSLLIYYHKQYSIISSSIHSDVQKKTCHKRTLCTWL